jgi:hypothetical protein
MLSARLALVAGLSSFAALPALADDLPPLMTSPTPDSGKTIQWNSPAGPAPSAPTASAPASAPPSSAPPPSSSQTVTPGNGAVTALPPGTTIHWADQPGAVAVPNAPGAPPPSGAVVAPDVRWKSFVRGDVVEIEIIDPAAYYRVDAVDLVAPDGREFPARELTHIAPSQDIPIRERGPNVGIGGWGGSSGRGGMGVGMSFPIGGTPPPPPDPDRNFARTVARILLANPAQYRRTAPSWSVRVRLLDPTGAASTARFAAPMPLRG